MTSLAHTIVFITGASSGIGHSCAHAFAEAGAKLILAARRKNRLEKIAADLKKQFNTETFIGELDVRDNHAVTKFYKNLPAEWRTTFSSTTPD